MTSAFGSYGEERALDAARRALDMIASRLKENERGEIDGIDAVRLGLTIMASALARLFAYPDARDDRNPSLDDVLSFLAKEARVDGGTVSLAERVIEVTGLASYYGLASDIIVGAEEARGELYKHLSSLMQGVKTQEEGSHG